MTFTDDDLEQASYWTKHMGIEQGMYYLLLQLVERDECICPFSDCPVHEWEGEG
jgi:hypothetical protein